jgi:hypothetical protein
MKFDFNFFQIKIVTEIISNCLPAVLKERYYLKKEGKNGFASYQSHVFHATQHLPNGCQLNTNLKYKDELLTNIHNLFSPFRQIQIE